MLNVLFIGRMAPKIKSAQSKKGAQAIQTRLEAKTVTLLGLVLPPPIQVECEEFTGSLGALFLCVKDRKIDLSNVPLAPICEAYFFYLAELDSPNLDEAGSALVALAYLLERKAWALLPTPEPEPQEVEQCYDLARLAFDPDYFSGAIDSLSQWKSERDQLYFRQTQQTDIYQIQHAPLIRVRVSDLSSAFEKVLDRAIVDSTLPRISSRRSMIAVMREVLWAVSDRWRMFNDLVPSDISRTDAVYWFLALLELIRIGQIDVRSESGQAEFSRRSKNLSAKSVKLIS